MKVTTDSCLFGAWVANDLKGLKSDQHILDIGSGSGLLSLMLAQQTKANIDGIELQKEEALQSTENILQSPFHNRIAIHHFDALQFEYLKKYDAIISNPPFYESDLKGNSKGKNIAHHDEGLKLNELMALIKKNLTATGFFYLLLPAKRYSGIESLLPELNFYLNKIVYVHQTEKHTTFRIMLKGSFQKTETEHQNLFIKKEGNYSDAFTALLKDYYLHL